MSITVLQELRFVKCFRVTIFAVDNREGAGQHECEYGANDECSVYNAPQGFLDVGRVIGVLEEPI